MFSALVLRRLLTGVGLVLVFAVGAAFWIWVARTLWAWIG